MAIAELLGSVQFVVNEQGERTAALLDIDAWQSLMDWLELIADTAVAAQALAELRAAGGRPEQAGWLPWEDLRNTWDQEEHSDAAAT